ncbi:MAG: transglycosylase domain-containing protein [Bdellovibrionaceae bacterium]|nr:transglycosylase domain-containing protein [Pseudobdellovibrionaceae bacterium]
MKISRSQIDLIIKFLFFIVGSFLVVTSAVRLLKPNLNNYPPLDSCFETSVHKVLLCEKNPNYISLDQISDQLVRAILMSEDDKFFDHKGVDWVEIKNSLKKNIQQRHFARGGSTLTQQLVKNAYLHQGKSLIRKFKEYFLAQALEEKYSKSLILEKYLNVVELGTDLYGVKRAAQFYFKKPVSDLELLESLYLVTLLPNPKRISKSFSDRKLSPWQIKKIKSLLKNFERRGQIDSSERVQYENALAQFPWDSQNPMDAGFDPNGMDLTEDQTDDLDAPESDEPVFSNFKATPASPDEEENPSYNFRPKNNSNDQVFDDTDTNPNDYGAEDDAGFEPPSSQSDSQRGRSRQYDEDDDRSSERDDRSNELPDEYDGEDEGDMGYDAEGF